MRSQANDNGARRIVLRLDGLRRSMKKTAVREGTIRTAGGLLAAGIAFLLLEMIFWLPPAWKKTLWLAIGTGLLAAAAGEIVLPLFSLFFRREDPADDVLAGRIGAHFPEIRDRLVNGLQVFRDGSRRGDGTSPELAAAAVEAAWEQVRPLDFDAAVPRVPRNRLFRFPAICAVAWLAGFLLFPTGLIDASRRLAHPGRRYSKPLPFDAVIRPGSVLVVEGDPLTLSVEGRGLFPGRVALHMREGGTDRSVELKRPFRYRIPSVRSAFDYYFRLSGFKSAIFEVRLLRRPELRSLDVTVVSPRYAGAERRTLEKNVGHVQGLKTSRVEVTIRAGKLLERADLVFESGAKIPMKTAGDRAAGSFSLTRDDRYRIELKDSLGLENSHPVRYSVRILPDRPPSAELLSPGSSAELDASGRITLSLEAADDYGVAGGRIGYWIQPPDRENQPAPDTGFIPLPVSGRPPLRFSREVPWDLQTLQLYPEDVVRYFFEAWDNDAVSGSKRGRSGVHSIRFPSVLEILRSAEEEHDRQLEAVERMAEDRRGFEEDVRSLSDLLKTGQSPSWSEKEGLQRGAERMQLQEERIRELQDRLDTLQERIESEDRMGREAAGKVRDLRRLYDEIDSPELRERMDRLREALERADPETLRQEAERFQVSQEDVLRALDRTISLMKRMKKEMQVDGLIRRIDEMARMQEELNEAYMRPDPAGAETRRQAAVREEERLGAESRSLERDAERISGSAAEIPEFPDSAFSDFLSAWKDAGFPDRFGSMTEKARAGEFSEAGRNGREMVRSLNGMKDRLDRIRDRLRNKTGALAALQRRSERILGLSDGQESLMAETTDGRRTGAAAAERQEALRAALEAEQDSLFSLSRETFSVTPRIAGALEEAMSGMKQSLARLENRDAAGAAAGQSRAMGSLNRAVLEIQAASEGLRSSGSGSGMEEFFGKMGEMSGLQMALNRKLEELLGQGGEGGLSLEAREGMPRLAEDQDALRRRLDALSRRFEGRNGRPGDMGGMIEDMQRTIDELKRGAADSGTLNRQRRVLSRMLESQTALREKDEGRQRRARTGAKVVRRSPDGTGQDPSQSDLLLRRRLLEMSEEGFTPEYRTWIRDYFEKLAKENR
jgi:hypothetical protein